MNRCCCSESAAQALGNSFPPRSTGQNHCAEVLGVDHAAGFARMEELLGADGGKGTGDRPVPPSPRESNRVGANRWIAKLRGRQRISRWYAAVAIAATVSLIIASSVMSSRDHARLRAAEAMWNALSVTTDQLNTDQRTQAEKVAALQARVAVLEDELTSSRLDLYGELLKSDNAHGLAMEDQIRRLIVPKASRPDQTSFAVTNEHAANPAVPVSHKGWVWTVSDSTPPSALPEYVRVGDVDRYALPGLDNSELGRIKVLWVDPSGAASQSAAPSERTEHVAVGMSGSAYVDIRAFDVSNGEGAGSDGVRLARLGWLLSVHNPTAMLRMAKRYEANIDHDRTEAVSWYRKAAQTGNEEARQALIRLGG
jgi:hypothetical protein